MAKTKVREVVRYITLNEANQIESSVSIHKLDATTFGVFGSTQAVEDPDLTGTLKKVTLSIHVEDVPQSERTAATVEGY